MPKIFLKCSFRHDKCHIFQTSQVWICAKICIKYRKHWKNYVSGQLSGWSGWFGQYWNCRTKAKVCYFWGCFFQLFRVKKSFKIFFCPRKHKKMPLKVAYLWKFGLFFSAAPTAQNSPELKIHIRNVAQDTSLYYSVRPWRNFFSASTANLQGNVCHILLPLWKVNRNDHN